MAGQTTDRAIFAGFLESPGDGGRALRPNPALGAGDAAGQRSCRPVPGLLDGGETVRRFAAGLTHALGARLPLADSLAFAARCGAAALTRRGPV